jgi:hypothetical protein
MSTDGMIYPTQKGMLAGNPRDSAIAQMNNTNTKQTSLVNAVGGKRSKKRYLKQSKKRTLKRSKTRYFNGGSIAVPQFTMLYTPQSGTGTDPNAQIKMNSQTSTQGTANSVYDQEAMKKGGSNPQNLKWGCMSGGKRKRKIKRKSKRKGNKRIF